MYDLHAHILPGIDDGPETMKEAVALAQAAAEHGTRVMVCTSHRKDVTENASVPFIRRLMADLEEEIEKNGLDIRLLMGMENNLDLDLPREVSEGRALPLNGSRYIMVELPLLGHPNYVEDVLFQLQLQGLTPVLAHTERIELLQRDHDLLERLVNRGMLSQITAGSIVGEFGGKIERTTHTFLRRGLAHIISSDAHFSRGHRSPPLRPGVDAAKGIVGEERAQAMVEDIPRAVVNDLPVEVETPRVEQRGRRWSRLFRS